MHRSVEVVEASIVGNSLKTLLARAKLTQEHAARLAGVSYRHFNRVVLCRSEPSLLFAARTSTILGEPITRIWKLRLRTRRRGAEENLTLQE